MTKMWRSRRKRWLPALTVPLLALLVAACGSSSSKGKNSSSSSSAESSGGTVYIASPVDLTGEGAGLGIPWQQALNAAVAYTNATGGLDGKKVVVDYRNVQTNPSLAAQVTNEMLSSGKYEIMIPSAGGTESLPIIQATKRYPKTVVIGSGTVPNWGKGSAYPMAFETDDSTAEAAEAAACAIQGAGAKKVAIMGLNDEYTKESDEIVTKKLHSLGIPVVGHQEMGLTTTNVTPEVQKLQQAGADTLLVDAYYTPLATILRAVKALNWNVQLIGSRQSTSIPLASFTPKEVVPAKMQGLAFAGQVKQSSGLTNIQKTAIEYIEKENKGKYAGSLTLYAYTWDAMMLVRWAAHEAKTTNGVKIAETLETLASKPNAETDTLDQNAPPYTKEIHEYNKTPYYLINQVAPMTQGTFPAVSEVNKC